MRSLDSSLLYEVRRELDAAPHGAKNAVLARYAVALDVSVATVRRHIRHQHGRAKECAGRGTTIPVGLVDAIWDEKVAAMEMGLQSRELPTRIALDTMRRLGIVGAAQASPSGINAAIKRLGYRRVARVQRMEPAFALDVVHFDFSRSKYFQLHSYDPAARGGQGDHVLRVYGRHLGYKEEDKTLRSWIVSIIDGHSRVARARLYPATGEDASFALMALQDFWTPEQAGDLALFHPARELWVDRGSAGRTEAFRESMASVGVEVVVVQSKEAQGKVERQYRTLWSAFEVALALELGEGATITMGDYNRRLDAFLVQQGAWNHPTMPGTRADAYAASLARVRPDGSPVERLLSGSLVGAYYDKRTRVVDATGCVAFERNLYLVPERVGTVWIEQGDDVRVYRYTDGALYGALAAHPGARPFLLAEGTRAASHPIARTETPSQAAAGRVDRRQRQDDRVGARQPTAEAVEPNRQVDAVSRPTASGLDLRQPADGPTVFAFRRPAEQLSADGPREESQADHPDALTGDELRRYVGRQLAPYGIGYADVADIFDGLAADPSTTRSNVDYVVSTLLRTARVA